MALGKLCQQIYDPGSAVAKTLSELSQSAFRASFTAFIVDHKLRVDSTVEARNVSRELARLGIESAILDLDWSRDGGLSSSHNVESIARRLRYQALGRACREQRITTLLLAHHCDDQAETIMMRMLSNYGGSGLRGMRSEAAIPECVGIYGVDHSGQSKNEDDDKSGVPAGYMAMEAGGVRIARPLLHVDKDQLTAICKQDGVQWFEDSTNADPTMTLRNTVRLLLRGADLPEALRKDRLLALAAKKVEEAAELEGIAAEAFRRIEISLETRSGEGSFRIMRDIQFALRSDPTICAMLLRKMIATVTPKHKLSLSEISSYALAVLRAGDTRTGVGPGIDERVQIAGVDIHRSQSENESVEITMNRAMPTSREREVLQTRLWAPEASSLSSSFNTAGGGRPDWQLWDGRYWIRALPPPAGNAARYTSVCARFLDKDDVAVLRKSVGPLELKELQGALLLARGSKRFICPVIVAKEEDGAGSEREQVVALPSLGWSREGWTRANGSEHASSWQWDIRFRHVEMSRQTRHKIM